ncbi:MAG: DUF433 domain-containing protein [Bacteroidales bacterium]
MGFEARKNPKITKEMAIGQSFSYFWSNSMDMKEYRHIITIEAGKRGGKPCIRGMRITVGDILGWLASGMTFDEILADFDELNEEDIYAALSYAADKENKIYHIAV